MTSLFSGTTAVPNIIILMAGIVLILLVIFLVALVMDRNPLPFPDRDYSVFSASSPTALSALERLMQRFGHTPRFRIDSDQVDRTVFSNGTIINYPRPEIFAELGKPGAALGFVVSDPDEAAVESIQLLRNAGFSAQIVSNAEPGLPIAFVTTDALSNAALVFRKHVLKMGKKPPAWTPRSDTSLSARTKT